MDHIHVGHVPALQHLNLPLHLRQQCLQLYNPHPQDLILSDGLAQCLPDLLILMLVHVGGVVGGAGHVELIHTHVVLLVLEASLHGLLAVVGLLGGLALGLLGRLDHRVRLYGVNRWGVKGGNCGVFTLVERP